MFWVQTWYWEQRRHSAVLPKLFCRQRKDKNNRETHTYTSIHLHSYLTDGSKRWKRILIVSACMQNRKEKLYQLWWIFNLLWQTRAKKGLNIDFFPAICGLLYSNPVLLLCWFYFISLTCEFMLFWFNL